jgi:hypothetical protein
LATTNNKILILSREGDNTYLSQYSYPDGDPEVEILISPTILTPTSIFVENGLIYVTDNNAIVYNIETSPPYTVTVITSPSINIYGASNSISCNNVSFEFTPTTYYKYRLCNDTNGPQTIVYQTEPSLTTIGTQTIFNLTTNTCWQYNGSSTTIPQNTTDDIIVYQGNYFTEVSSTIYTNCAQCISETECNPPSNLTSYPFSFAYKFNNGPNINWPQSETEICDIIYSLVEDLSNNVIDSWGVSSQPIYLESLEVGSYAYLNQANCNCYGDGFYYIRSFILNIYTIVELSNCVIVNLWPCNPENGTSPSNPNGTGGSGGSGGNNGNTPDGGPNPSSITCQCTAVRTISGFQGTAFYTDCDGNPAQITVPGGAGIAGAACFCRQSNTPVTGAVVIEACQSSFSQGTINNICNSTILCN